MLDAKTIKLLLEQGPFFLCFVIMLFWLIRYYVPKTIEANLAITDSIKELDKRNRINTQAVMLMVNQLSVQLTWVEAKSHGANDITDDQIKTAVKEAFRRSEEETKRTREKIEQLFKD